MEEGVCWSSMEDVVCVHDEGTRVCGRVVTQGSCCGGHGIITSSGGDDEGDDGMEAGWTSVWYELLVLTVFLRGVRIMVWETGRFSRVELRRERRV